MYSNDKDFSKFIVKNGENFYYIADMLFNPRAKLRGAASIKKYRKNIFLRIWESHAIINSFVYTYR